MRLSVLGAMTWPVARSRSWRREADELSDPKIPTVGEYRGVPLHDFRTKSVSRLCGLRIDDVFEIKSHRRAVRLRRQRGKSPESRLLVRALLRAEHQWPKTIPPHGRWSISRGSIRRSPVLIA